MDLAFIKTIHHRDGFGVHQTIHHRDGFGVYLNHPSP